MGPSNYSEAIARLEGRLDRHEDRLGEQKRWQEDADVAMDALKEFVNMAKGEKIQREQEHKENRFRLNILIGLISALALYLAIFVHH